MTATRGVRVGNGHKSHLPATWNGRGKMPAGWCDPSPPGTLPLSVGLIAYSNWWKGAYEHVPEIGNAGTLRTAFTHRQPLAYEPNFYQSDPALTTISLVREQEIVDNILQACDAGGIDYLGFNWYPDVALQDVANYPSEADHENLLRFWKRYQASAYRSLVKWCWMPTAGWLRDATNAQKRINSMVQQIDDQSLRVHPSRPVFFLFDYVTGALRWDITWTTALRTACKAAGHGNPYLIGQGYSTPTAITAGLDARSAYGPLDVTLSSGQQSWATMTAADASATQFVSASMHAVPHLSGGTDQRPILVAGWSDPASASQWIAAVKAAKTFIDANPTNCPQNLALIYSLDEHAERGGILGTAQNDVHATGRGYFFDCIAHAVGKTPLTNVWNSVTAINLTYCVRSGTWSYVTGVAGAFDSNTIESTQTGAYNEFTATTAASGIIRVYGSKTPDGGVVSITVDGGAATLVDTYNATTQRMQLLFEVTGLSAASHVVRATVNGTKNGSSSGFKVSLENWRALVPAP